MEHQATERFYQDFAELSPTDQELFRRRARQLCSDLARGRPSDNLNVRVVTGFTGILEMTWAQNARATFSVGGFATEGPVIMWRRVGRWDVLPEDPT